MKLADNDLDESYFQSIRKGNDKTVSYLFVSVVVFFLFSLFLIGMQRSQSISDQTTVERPRPAYELNPEIGDVDEKTNE